MGASWFQQTGYGKTLKNAYDNACEEAEVEYGHQEGYNGTISTTHGVKDVTDKYKNSKMSLENYMHSQKEVLNKRDCCAICLQEPVGNKNKTKSQVEHLVTPGTKKWVLKYVVYDDALRMITSCDTKGEAVKKGREYTEKHQSSTYICMEKTLDKGNKKVAIIKYKRSTTEKPGKWVLFGWAAE